MVRKSLIELLRGSVRVEHVKNFFVWEVVTQRVGIFLVELSGYSGCDAKIFLYGKI